ncbi:MULTISPECIES: hypothetical protein [Curtobacterium]|uniref:hypothetical protein n=1 Tax=Curtobacterium TaxID=2034 RepID=UPI00217D4357|nr:hypothetical protein [Curtobacterium flaccumfaciens]MCS6562299.1 hypothetical protein [Curtobacterium flaccumfaciens pv. poinsettiae]UXN28368.1 hypothetical protein N8D75_15415 [Curtobacterium flaccumfaciens]
MSHTRALGRWVDWDPNRLDRDRRELAEIAPELDYQEPAPGLMLHGGWVGQIPLWPFDRAVPAGLNILVNTPMTAAIAYAAAHPVIAPKVYPLDPEPLLAEMSDTVWHVSPGGSLCLFQSEGMWDPSASIGEIIQKSAGWRVEYALMKLGAIAHMTERGIASDSELDGLVTDAATELKRGLR